MLHQKNVSFILFVSWFNFIAQEKYLLINFFEMAYWINRASFSLINSEEFLSSWILPNTALTSFLWSAATAPAGWQRHHLSVWASGVLLFDVGIQSWI